ncbi:hypothetical protein CBM2633_P160012 [Cupriavidus taiwanensis]|uniref:Uncharacterized protein n=2 Tax=Cupriavidus TaxID=106589 RepID=A0A375HVY9_9BURK|nr:hypothetical protein CBM2588_P180012 [Cupriavidus taiwanensis]SOZ40448.1 hypothetical protein CBM2605_P160012 [Cupriavidus neocaledonicus]SOY74560.1 hypothetical protein CBM2592_P190011 [Cupriavidus taiwanensis]SOY74564.1 hypothetical protein CBM2585_P160013 [Cupriavidus taiwanensis]SOY75457.1 hypothetical protein CBM2589_P160011 [Cupriavidus taiwanensis]
MTLLAPIVSLDVVMLPWAWDQMAGSPMWNADLGAAIPEVATARRDHPDE